jgi:hypothetical protein
MSLQSIENSLCRAQKNYQRPTDKIGRGLLALIDLTYYVGRAEDKEQDALPEDYKRTLRNIRKLSAKLMAQLESVRYHTDKE